MFKVFIDGNDDRLRLEDENGRRIGWIRGHAIGFTGLPSDESAIRAVLRGWPALDDTLQRAYPGKARHHVKASNVGIIHDGAYDWVADGYYPLARLLRPGIGGSSEESIAVEFLTPSYATQHVTIAVAQAVWEALAGLISIAAVAAAFTTSFTNDDDQLAGVVALEER
jgi:hypothetical protein